MHRVINMGLDLKNGGRVEIGHFVFPIIAVAIGVVLGLVFNATFLALAAIVWLLVALNGERLFSDDLARPAIFVGGLFVVIPMWITSYIVSDISVISLVQEAWELIAR